MKLGGGVLLMLVLAFGDGLDAFAEPVCQAYKVERYFDGRQAFQKGPYFFVIEKGRIASIRGKATSVPKHCPVTDLKGIFITPGLIDAHTHLFLTDKSFGKDFSSELLRDLNRNTAKRSAAAKAYARSMLHSGFTSVRDLGNSGRFLDIELKNQIAAGKAEGPRLFVSGPGFAAGVGQYNKGTESGIARQEYEPAENVKAAKKRFVEYKDRGADWIKIYADNDPNPEVLPAEKLSVLIRAAKSAGLPVAVHATRKESVRAAAEAGADTIEHAYDPSEKELKAFARKKTYMVFTDFGSAVCAIVHRHNPDPYYDCADYHKRRKARLQAARKAGVMIAFGSDMYMDLGAGGPSRGRAAVSGLSAMFEYGLPAEEVLMAATSTNAALLRRSDLGTLSPGARADLAGFAGNPLRNIEDLNKAVLVMKDGVEICSPRKPCTDNP